MNVPCAIAAGIAIFLSFTQLSSQEVIWMSQKGEVVFSSTAPLELITAKSKHLKGAINTSTKSFAFAMNINSFEGFNSEIQQTHFLENYLEQKKYPRATFTGKLIEEISFNQPGTYVVRAKGVLEIHGVPKERIIKGTLVVHELGGRLTTAFSVPVNDHGIAIPRIVQQKIADQIQVTVEIEFSIAPQ
jgi:polyisoprenoid-binding protein YceI